jgi:shikimate kinase
VKTTGTGKGDEKMAGDNLILIGMPAVGKSTVGVLLAKRMGYGFIDTDLLIQSGERRKLHQLIGAYGLTEFCNLESAYIERIEARQSVIATGGSVVYRPAAMAHLNTLGTIIFLDIEPAALEERLEDLGKRGVVFAPGQSIADLYSERRPLYRKYAHATVHCTALDPEAAVAAIRSIVDDDPLFSPAI